MWPSIWYFIHVVDASVCVLPVTDNRKKKSKFQAKLKRGEKNPEKMFRAQSMHMPGPKLLYKAGHTWRPAIAWIHIASGDHQPASAYSLSLLSMKLRRNPLTILLAIGLGMWRHSRPST